MSPLNSSSAPYGHNVLPSMHWCRTHPQGLSSVRHSKIGYAPELNYKEVFGSSESSDSSVYVFVCIYISMVWINENCMFFAYLVFPMVFTQTTCEPSLFLRT